MTAAARTLASSKRLVIKIGSSLLCDPASGLRRDWLTDLMVHIAALHNKGTDVIVVTSGSIALGSQHLRPHKRPSQLEDLQAAAALGQVDLIAAYGDALIPHGLRPAQMLITLADFEDRKRFLNARGTLEALLGKGFVPVFNENDTVATSEIRFGDNDRLAARVAQMAGADLLILLSDVDGLYTADPTRAPDAEFLPVVSHITPEIIALAGPSSDASPGSGGMITKIDAARTATDAGCAMIIASGQIHHPLAAIEKGARCTLFTPEKARLDARKGWIRGLMAPSGFLHLDKGAEAAIRDGNSLLPAGVTQIVGQFDRGALVALINPSGGTIGQGLAAYPSDDARKICGRHLDDIVTILGFMGRSALVHRDDMVVF